MKNKKKLCIIGVSALCIVIAVVLCITLIPKHNGDKPAESEAKEASSGTISPYILSEKFPYPHNSNRSWRLSGDMASNPY